jgi:hypothetical protein
MATPRALYYLKTILALSVFLILSEWLWAGTVFFMAPFAVLIVLLPAHVLLIYALFNLVCGMFHPLLVPYSPKFVATDSISVVTFAIAFIAATAFFYFYARLTRSWSRPAALLTLISIVLGFSFFIRSENFFLLSFALSLARGVFFNAFYLRSMPEVGPQKILPFLASQPGFYYRHISPIPPLMGELIPTAQRDEELLRLRYRAIYVLLLTVGAKWILDHSAGSLSHWFLLSEKLSDSFHPLALPTSVQQIFQMPGSLLQKWGIVLINYSLWLIKIFLLGGFAVATSMIVGVDTKLPVYDLFGARSMFQLFERTNPYYCRVILDVFVYPIYRIVSVRKSKFVTGGKLLLQGNGPET